MQSPQKSLLPLFIGVSLVRGVPRQSKKSVTVINYSLPSLLEFSKLISHLLDKTLGQMVSIELGFEFFPSNHLASIHCSSNIPPCSGRSTQIVGGIQYLLCSF